jgi:hypothetical protein
MFRFDIAFLILLLPVSGLGRALTLCLPGRKVLRLKRSRGAICLILRVRCIAYQESRIQEHAKQDAFALLMRTDSRNRADANLFHLVASRVRCGGLKDKTEPGTWFRGGDAMDVAVTW